MDPNIFKETADGLNSMVEGGKELKGAINNINQLGKDDVEAAAKARRQAAHRARYAGLFREVKAYQRLEEKKDMDAKREEMKNEIIRKYGPRAMMEYEELLKQVEKEEKEESRKYNKDAEFNRWYTKFAWGMSLIITLVLWKMGFLTS
jgi:hypothetical protein